MSKRAEERARTFYSSENFDTLTLLELGCKCFSEGYEQAEKDTIERAIIWLKENWREYVWTTDNGIPHFGHWENDFRKAMEEE